MDCIFCKIIRKEIPSKLVYEDTECVAFQDIQPAAPVHILIVPRNHVEKFSDTRPEDTAILGHLQGMAREIASKAGLKDYRLVLNNGASAGQSVWHLHYHLLSGRNFSWPPG